MLKKPLDAPRQAVSSGGLGISIGRSVAWEINAPLAETERQSSCMSQGCTGCIRPKGVKMHPILHAHKLVCTCA